jgi:predicted DNA-binding transcriptional regulator AlpA
MSTKSRNRTNKQDSSRGPWNTLEVAAITEINRMTISRWLDDGKVRAPKQDPRSREYLWTQSDIDELVRYAKSREKQGEDK